MLSFLFGILVGMVIEITIIRMKQKNKQQGIMHADYVQNVLDRVQFIEPISKKEWESKKTLDEFFN